jgi:hypothetical protein
VFQSKSFSRRSFKSESWAPILVPELPPVSGGVGGYYNGRRPLIRDWTEKIHDVAHLHRDDQIAAELLVALVTQGFFDGNH